MTKRYRESLEEVEVGRLGRVARAPVAFRWRGRRYRVVAVLGHWREDPGWWRRPDGQPIEIEQADLWRVEVRNGAPARSGVFELACRGGVWRLDRVWD